MVSLQILFALAIFASGQEEREYVAITGAQRRELELRQDPELRALAAMSGERVFIRITGAESLVLLSEDVSASFDCLP